MKKSCSDRVVWMPVQQMLEFGSPQDNYAGKLMTAQSIDSKTPLNFLQLCWLAELIPLDIGPGIRLREVAILLETQLWKFPRMWRLAKGSS